MKPEKKCVCTDKDPYTCFYERYLEVFHKKYPDEGEEPEVEDVLFTDVIYCWCNCHDNPKNKIKFGEGWLTKNDISLEGNSTIKK